MKTFDITVASSHKKGAVAILCTEKSTVKTPSKAFSGKFSETVLVYGESNTLYVGIGEEKDLNPLVLKELGGIIGKAFTKDKIFDFAVDFGDIKASDAFYSNIAQGIILGTYSYSLKSKKEEDEKLSVILIGSSKTADSALQEGLTLAEATVFARDLTNAPSSHLRPKEYAEIISKTLTTVGVECEIFSDKDLKKMGMNGLFLIGDSSDFPPQMVVMRYNGGGKGKKTALVGKGVTFDTGGYCLKPSGSMEAMQGDMAGSAAVVGAMYAIAKNKVNANVVGVVALCENRISDESMLPGDVYTAYDGQTVEVLNTDAEGRLVLADAVAYAVKDEGAEQVVDIATLTGAVVVALGHGVAGTVTNDQKMFEKVWLASELSGERYWNFPTYPEYDKMLDSKIADMKNIGKREGGVITGGLFIGRFVADKPWIHLDIAGTSWSTPPTFQHQTDGASGAGLDTMYYLCKTEG